MKLRNSLFAKLIFSCLMLLSFAAGVIAVIAAVYMCIDVGVYHNNYRDTGQYQQQVRWDSDVIFNYYELLQKAETESTNEQELEGLRNQIFLRRAQALRGC